MAVSSLRAIVASSRRLDDMTEGRNTGPLLNLDKRESAVFWLLCLLMGIIIITIFTLVIRDWLWMSCGISCCRELPRRTDEEMDVPVPNGGGRGRHPQRASPAGVSSASEDEQTRAIRLQTRRMQRRSWYEYYLKKYTQIVSEKDIISESNLHGESSEMSLSVNCSNGSSRVVESRCSICLSDYEVGEKVVRSPLSDCRHVYHEECMLLWLTKGKKRCPICRHWFVPGIRIEDQISAEFGEDV